MIGETSNKPRVAMLITSLAGGGAEKAVTMLLQGFAPERYELHLIVNRKEGPYMSLLPSYVHVSEMNTPRLRSAWKAYIRTLRHIRPDVVISHMWENNVLNVVGRRLSGLRFATVLCEHSSISRNRGTGVNMMRWWCYKRADAVIGCSRVMGEELQQILRVPVSLTHVIYNAVLDDSFYKRAKAEYKHPWLSQDWGKAETLISAMDDLHAAEPEDAGQVIEGARIPVLLGLGRLSPEKRYDLLVEAVHRLHQRGHKVRALIIGEGAERDRLTKLIADRELEEWIDLPGYAANPLPILRQADIYVQSSDVEGLPTALIEAVALGTSIVATRTATGTEEVLEGIDSALLVPCGDVEKMAEALEKQLERVAAEHQNNQGANVQIQHTDGLVKSMANNEIASSYESSVHTQFQRLNKFTLSYVIEQYEELISDVLRKQGIKALVLTESVSSTEAISVRDGTVRKGVSR